MNTNVGFVPFPTANSTSDSNDEPAVLQLNCFGKRTVLDFGEVSTIINSIWVHPDYFVKLDFEIAVDQQTRARDRTFKVFPDSGCPPVPAGQPRPYLVNLWPNFAK